MIHVDFDPENRPETLTPQQLEWWKSWQEEAAEATKAVIEAWEKGRGDPSDVTFKKIFEKSSITAVWGKLKDWLLENIFHNKCAYCETTGTRFQFHAEHYRPKKAVTAKGKKIKVTDQDGNELNHPGYFWLAFHWKNLLPSCALCNTINGKKNQFPIIADRPYFSVMRGLSQQGVVELKEQIIQSPTWPDVYYLQPLDLDEMEGRLLLHPYFDEPRNCITFDDFGKAIATGNEEERLRGEFSIEAYNLNAESLITDRNGAQREAETSYQMAYLGFLREGKSINQALEDAKVKVEDYLTGRKRYSAAVIDFLALAHKGYF